MIVAWWWAVSPRFWIWQRQSVVWDCDSFPRIGPSIRVISLRSGGIRFVRTFCRWRRRSRVFYGVVLGRVRIRRRLRRRRVRLDVPMIRGGGSSSGIDVLGPVGGDCCCNRGWGLRRVPLGGRAVRTRAAE